jgi:hypothetical protein
LAAAVQAIDLMRDRSPGVRRDAQLTKTKKTSFASGTDAGRTARALPRVRTPAGVVPLPIAEAPFAAALPAVAEAAPAAFPALFFGAPMFMGGPGGGTFFGPGPSIIPPIGGGGGGGGVIILPPAPPETPPVAPIPEPATWLTLILGFGILGAVARRVPRLAFA